MKITLLIIAFLGLLVSGYLLITYVSPVPLICVTGGGCSKVQASSYAFLFGIPTPLFGVVYYLAVGLLATLWQKDTVLIGKSLMLITLLGFLFSAWLTYLEAFVIQAWCSWCVASAVLATGAFIYVWLKADKN